MSRTNEVSRRADSRSRIRFSLWPTAITVAAIVCAVTTMTANAATVSCIQATPGPAPQLRVSGYETATIHDTAYPIPPHAVFVANTGNDHNPGTVSAPLASIGHAISVAPAGGTIVVRGGVYRESLGNLPRRVTIQAYPHEAPWVRGSVVLNGFASKGGAWVASWTSPFCDTCYQPAVLDPKHPAAGLPEQVFVDGVPLGQVTSRSALAPHTFYVDHAAHQLVLFDNPTGHTVEVTQRASAFTIGSQAAGTVIRGLGFEHWGATYNGDAAVVVQAPATFDNDTFAWSAARGIQLYGANDIVTNSSIVDNGMSGMNIFGASAVDVEHDEFAYSNYEHWSIAPSKYAEIAGVKNMNTVGSLYRYDTFHDNDSNGLWFDQQSSKQVVVHDTIVHNSGHGLAVEISGDSIVAGNVVAENGRDGMKLSGASAADVYNNSVVDNGFAQVGVYEDPRHPNGGITLANDIFMAGPRSIKNVLRSYDIEQPGALTTLQMIAADAHNLYGRTNTSRPSTSFYTQTTAQACTTYADLAAFRAATHRELASASADGVALTHIFVDAAHGNYAIAPGAPLPVPTTLPTPVAAALGSSTIVSHVGA